MGTGKIQSLRQWRPRKRDLRGPAGITTAEAAATARYQEQQALIVLSNEDSLDLTEFHEDFIRRVIEQVTVLSKDRILVRFVGGFEVEGKIPQGN